MPIQEPSSQGHPSAPYSGGYGIRGDMFFVDGDFTQCDPCGMPVISYPVKGDSILATNNLIVFNPATLLHAVVPLGTYPNIHPWNPKQQVGVLEQEFMVAQAYYQAMPLNTPYWPGWSLGFQNVFPSGYPTFDLNQLYLVEEGELEDMGGGISKIRRKWATIPPTRCEIEQFVATFVGLDTTGDGSGQLVRGPFTRNVMSRLQYDYFIFDDLGILSLPLFDNATPGNNRLDSTTGMYPAGLIIPVIQMFADASQIAQGNGNFTGNYTDSLNNDPESPSIPDSTQYLDWAFGSLGGSGANALPAEICAESSSFTRWMGNIWERRTRFVLAQ